MIAWGPGLVSAPRVGRSDDSSVFAAIDLAVSLLAVARVAAPGNVKFDGENLAGTLLGNAPASRQAALCFRRPPDRPGERGEDLPDLAIRQGDWKLLCEYDGSQPQLYDLARDRRESSNLAADHADVVGRLKDTLLAWHRSMPPDAGPALERDGTAPAPRVKKPPKDRPVVPRSQ